MGAVESSPIRHDDSDQSPPETYVYRGRIPRTSRDSNSPQSWLSPDDDEDFHSISGESEATVESFRTADDTPASFVSATSGGAANISRNRRKKRRSARSRILHADSGVNTPLTVDNTDDVIELVFEDDLPTATPSPRKLRFSLAGGSLTKEKLEAFSHELEKFTEINNQSAESSDHVCTFNPHLNLQLMANLMLNRFKTMINKMNSKERTKKISLKRTSV